MSRWQRVEACVSHRQTSSPERKIERHEGIEVYRHVIGFSYFNPLTIDVANTYCPHKFLEPKSGRWVPARPPCATRSRNSINTPSFPTHPLNYKQKLFKRELKKRKKKKEKKNRSTRLLVLGTTELSFLPPL